MEKEEYVVVRMTPDLPFDYSAGEYGSKFLIELKENGRFLASKCSNCECVLVPCRTICANCSHRMKELVEVGPRGTLKAYTVVKFAFMDPFTGEQRPVPYGWGIINLDGADDNFPFFLEESDWDKLHVDLRVEAVLKDKKDRTGSYTDIIHFRTVED